MNTVVDKLVKQSLVDVIKTKGMSNIVDGCYVVSPDRIEQLVMIIAQECIDVVSKKCASPTAYNALVEHFGVE